MTASLLMAQRNIYFLLQCVRHGKNGERWEKGRNRVLTIPSDTVAKVEVELTWGGEMEVTTQKEPAKEQSGGHNSWGADKVEQLSSNSLVPVTISINREVGMGQSHVLVGSHPAVGEWKIGAGAHMKWEVGNVWHSSLELEPGTSLEFKVGCQRSCASRRMVDGSKQF